MGVNVEPIVEIKPQEGFQEQFINSQADIVWGGGAAGAGKSFALFLCFLRFALTKEYGGVIFRRTYQQVTNEGGLWDTAVKLFSQLSTAMRPVPTRGDHMWTFPTGNKLTFSHLQHEHNYENWQGSQVSFLCFDELTQFTKSQFWYLVGRMRSTSGFRALCRCTMNPQGEGWVKDFLVSGGFIYPDDYTDPSLAGYPVPERSGMIRFFLKHNDVIIWGDTDREVAEQLPEEVRSEYTSDDIKSFTFIAGKLEDNPILTTLNPTYRGSLMAQDAEKRAQLLDGRWSKLADDALKLIPGPSLIDLFTNDFVDPGDAYLTADIAMEGKDLFVIMIWYGWRMTHVYTYPTTLGDGVLRKIKETATRHRVPGRNIAFDSQGVGNYLKGFMRNSVSVSGAAKPLKVKGQAQRYENLRSQLYFHARDKIEACEAYCEVSKTTTEGWALYKELDVINKLDRGKDEKLAIESKAAIKLKIKGSSPDYGDAFTMRSIFDLRPQPQKRIPTASG